MPTIRGHNPDDVDDSEVAIHHTLGFNRHQALPGDALSGFSLKGPAPTDPLIKQIVSALILLGANDETN
jgi:hypothetical protein